MSRSSIGVFASVAIVLLLVIHVSSQPPPTTPPTDPGGTARSTPPCPRPSTREELNAAMLSVYYHAAAQRPPPGPHRWRPISPVEAGRILRCDSSVGASGRQRRAIVKLGARILMLRVLHTPDANDRAEELLAAVEEIYPDADAIISSVPADGHDDVATFEMSLQMKLDSAPSGPKRTCCSCMDYCKVYPTDPKDTGVARVVFGISTPRGYKSLATVLDPQAWDTCEKIYFPKTYFTGDTCPSGTSIPPEIATHPTEGTTWPAGILFEHFDSNFKWGKAYFKNLLNINTLLDEGKGMYSMDYGLCGALESQVLNEPSPLTGIGVDEDCGYVRAIDKSASPTKEESLVNGLKCIKFSKRGQDFGLADWAQFGLEAMADGVANLGVCCGAESDTECKCHEDCAQASLPPDAADPKLCKNPRQCNPTVTTSTAVPPPDE